jgi:N-glycosylase/DNA lyase
MFFLKKKNLEKLKKLTKISKLVCVIKLRYLYNVVLSMRDEKEWQKFCHHFSTSKWPSNSKIIKDIYVKYNLKGNNALAMLRLKKLQKLYFSMFCFVEFNIKKSVDYIINLFICIYFSPESKILWSHQKEKSTQCYLSAFLDLSQKHFQ